MSHNSSKASKPSHDQHQDAKWQALSDTDKVTHLDQLFEKTLYRARCPSAETLGDLLANMLPSNEAQTVQQHADTCQLCSAELTDLQNWLAQFPEPAAVEQPSPWKKLTQFIAEQVTPHSSSLLSPQYRLVSAKRSASQKALSYTYLIQQAAIPITIRIVADTMHVDRYEMNLVNLYSTEEPLTAALWLHGQGAIATKTLSEGRKVSFSNLSPGQYEVILSNTDTEIYLRNILIQ